VGRTEVTRTQQERKAETRGRLLDAAAVLFAARGVDAVSVDAVAEAAGRTSGAVYAHFGSKQGLLLALLDEWKQSMLTVLFAAVAVAGQPRDQLAAVWESLTGDAAGPGQVWSLLEDELWLRAGRDPDVAALLSERNAEARSLTARQLAAWALRVGATPVGDAETTATLLRALLRGLEQERRVDPTAVPPATAVLGLATLLGLPPDQQAGTSDTHATAPTTRRP
jgi:AcrR family transcriptional regulator